MATNIGTILRQATCKPNEKYNCLTFPTHERYQSNMENVNANFFMLQGTPGVKGNGWVESYAPMPFNHVLLPAGEPLQMIPVWMDIDMCLGQHKFGQAQTALQLSQYFGCPSILLEHTTVTSENLRQNVPQLREIRGDANVFISRSSAEAWGWSVSDPSVEIIHHGINTELFKPMNQQPKQPHILCVVNDWVNRGDILGWDIFNRVVVNNKLPVRVIGDTQNVSRPAESVYHLAQAYRESAIFYNTSRHSPIPTVILEAMACEIPVVTTDNYLISEVIVNGVNGYKTNSEDEQLKHLRRLLNDPAERSELGKNARKTILDNFNLNTFVENWNRVFKKVMKS